MLTITRVDEVSNIMTEDDDPSMIFGCLILGTRGAESYIALIPRKKRQKEEKICFGEYELWSHTATILLYYIYRFMIT